MKLCTVAQAAVYCAWSPKFPLLRVFEIHSLVVEAEDKGKCKNEEEKGETC